MNDLDIFSINRVAEEVHKNANAKGFHPADETLPQFIPQTVSNMHGEVSEFWEAYRKGVLLCKCDKEGCELSNAEEELADIVIRAFDTAMRMKLDIGQAIALKHAYNKTRAFRHGDKKA